jgi:ribonuclease HI
MPKQKYYVVWSGHRPGVYSTWSECQQQISGYPGAKYKSFARRDDAEKAFTESYDSYVGQATKTLRKTPDELAALGVNLESVSTDAACSGNPGDLEYQAVDTRTREVLFHRGPFPEGTINIGEFLAIVHALAWLKQAGRNCPVYSDSRVAIGWVRDRAVNTRLVRTAANAPLFERLDRAVRWLVENNCSSPILKWQTDRWGENPADFDRK